MADGASSNLIVEEVRHSTRGASSAKRWMNCVGSCNIIEKLPQGVRRSTRYAAEGTAAHTVLAKCLDDRLEPWELMGNTIVVDGWEFPVDQDMSDAVNVGLNFVQEKMNEFREFGAILRSEHAMFSILDEDAFGTGDIVIEVPQTRIIITDYKHGIGIPVEADDPQLKYYGYLAIENASMELTDDTPVDLYVIQPRCPHPKGHIRKHSTTVGALKAWWLEVLLPAMEATRNPNALLKIGDWCRFCPASSELYCPAIKSEIADLKLDRDPEAMTAEELGLLLQKEPAFIKFFEKAKAIAFNRARQGDKIPGQKVVWKKANRVFKAGAETEARSIWGDQATMSPPTFLGPPQIEKLPPKEIEKDGQIVRVSGKDFVTKWAYTPATGLTLAPITDARAEVTNLLDRDDI